MCVVDLPSQTQSNPDFPGQNPASASVREKERERERERERHIINASMLAECLPAAFLGIKTRLKRPSNATFRHTHPRIVTGCVRLAG
jgi:hypothetical protein